MGLQKEFLKRLLDRIDRSNQPHSLRLLFDEPSKIHEKYGIVQNISAGDVPVDIWPYLRCFRSFIGACGSVGTNDGQITIREKGGSNRICAVIPAGYGQTHQAIYTVPVNESIFIEHLIVSQIRASGALGSGTVAIMWRNPGKGWRTRLVNTSTAESYDSNRVMKLTSGTDFKVQVRTVSDPNNFFTAEWEGEYGT